MISLEQNQTKTYAARVRPRGQITIPQPVRDALSLNQGDVLTIAQVGDVILLTPRQLRTPDLAAQFTAKMEEEGVTLAEKISPQQSRTRPVL